MGTASTKMPSRLGTTVRSRSLLRGAAAGAVTASLVNAALWGGGRPVDASFVVNPPLGATTLHVGLILVVLTTLLAFAVGSGVLALAARRSRRSVRAVLIAAALVAVVSAVGPLSAAEDAATGVLLAAMHLGTGIIFVVTSSRIVAS